MPLEYSIHDRVSDPPPAVKSADRVRSLGRDVKFDGDTRLDPAGRYVLVEGLAALRQAVLHALVTEPGAYRLFPAYGVGVMRYVGLPRTPARVDEIKNRVAEGLLQLRRVEEVREVVVDVPDEYSLRVHLIIVAAARTVRFQPFDFRRE